VLVRPRLTRALTLRIDSRNEDHSDWNVVWGSSVHDIHRVHSASSKRTSTERKPARSTALAQLRATKTASNSGQTGSPRPFVDEHGSAVRNE